MNNNYPRLIALAPGILVRVTTRDEHMRLLRAEGVLMVTLLIGTALTIGVLVGIPWWMG